MKVTGRPERTRTGDGSVRDHPAPPGRGRRVAAALGLERNVVAVASAMFLLALGENLWKRFLPKYLQALGAPIGAIGLFGTCQDLLDGLYQYPGGWIGDRYGRRRGLLLFVALATVGYAVYWWAPWWPLVFVGLALAMAWSSMASPTPFVIATFVAFALFPVAVVLAGSFPALVGAFVVGGLREIGEPARKALIVDLAPPAFRARTVGLYYLIRSLAVAPAALVGGLLWSVTPALPFWTAGAIGGLGVLVFVRTVEEH